MTNVWPIELVLTVGQRLQNHQQSWLLRWDRDYKITSRVGSYVNISPTYHHWSWLLRWDEDYKISSRVGSYINVQPMYHHWSWLLHWDEDYKITSRVGCYVDVQPTYHHWSWLLLLWSQSHKDSIQPSNLYNFSLKAHTSYIIEGTKCIPCYPFPFSPGWTLLPSISHLSWASCFFCPLFPYSFMVLEAINCPIHFPSYQFHLLFPPLLSCLSMEPVDFID